jgi:hypothetical protein
MPQVDSVALHFLPSPIAFDAQNGAFRVVANGSDGTIDVTIGRDALEALSAEKHLSKDEALTVLVKNQARLLAVADRLYAAAGPDARHIAISAADLAASRS